MSEKKNVSVVDTDVEVTSADTSEKVTPITYTEEQMREAYNEGQANGFLSAIRQIRTELNDYLNDLVVAIRTNNQ